MRIRNTDNNTDPDPSRQLELDLLYIGIEGEKNLTKTNFKLNFKKSSNI